MEDLEELREMLKTKLEAKEVQQTALAKELRIDPATLSRFAKCEGGLGRENYRKLSRWAERQSLPTIRQMGAYAPKIVVGEDGKRIEAYQVAGAGQAWEIVAVEPLKSIHAPLAFASKIAFALLIRGGSMEPTMKSGAVVGVSNDKRFQHNEIFAVDIPYEGLAVKRVTIDHASKEYILVSDNPDKAKHGDIRIKIEEAQNLLVGRVVWVWQGG